MFKKVEVLKNVKHFKVLVKFLISAIHPVDGAQNKPAILFAKW